MATTKKVKAPINADPANKGKEIIRVDYAAAGFGPMEVYKKRVATTTGEFLAWQQELIDAGFFYVEVN